MSPVQPPSLVLTCRYVTAVPFTAYRGSAAHGTGGYLDKLISTCVPHKAPDKHTVPLLLVHEDLGVALGAEVAEEVDSNLLHGK